MRRSQIYLVLILFVVGYFLMEGKFKKRFTSEEKEEYELISQKYFKNLKIYRDEWGVPHIYGETDEKCAFGVGFVTCEYNFDMLQQMFLASRGILAHAVGYKHASNDYYVHLIKTWDIIDQHYEKEVSEEGKKISEGYAAAINYYASTHEDQLIDRMLFPITGKDIFALMIHKLPTFVKFDRIINMLMQSSPSSIPPLFLSPRFDHPITSQDEYDLLLLSLLNSPSPFNNNNNNTNDNNDNNNNDKNDDKNEKREEGGGGEGEWRGSNAFVVGKGKERGEGGKKGMGGYININPHTQWEGPHSLFELHIHSDEITIDRDLNQTQQWNTVGFTYPGMPFILIGHNEKIGWTHTINHPDILDIFLLQINPEDENQYWFDGQWKNFEITTINTKVKLIGPVVWTVSKERVWCEYGPVVKSSLGVFAVALSGLDHSLLRFVDQYLTMNKANSLDEWKKGIQFRSFPLFNYLYADHEGNIYYQYNAKIPIRSQHYLWDEMVPGNTSETKWKGIVDLDHLPYLENPTSGFIQNCNTSPFNLTLPLSLNPLPSLYPLSFGIEKTMNNRGIRALELLGNSNEISWDYFKEIKYDIVYSNNSLFIDIKRRLIERCEIAWEKREQWMGNSLMLEALEVMKEWNNCADEYNSEAAVPILTIYPFVKHDLWDSHRDFNEVDIDRVAERLQLVVIQLKKRYKRLRVQWHVINRLVHGKEVNFPLEGGPDLLFSIYGAPHKGEDHLVGVGGDSTIMMVRWENNVVKSEAIVPFGSSQYNPKSPHFADQSAIFADRSLRKVVFSESELIGKESIDFSTLLPQRELPNFESDNKKDEL